MSEDSITILPLPYFGNISFYTALFQESPLIDIHSNYRKQTFRNRCEILTDQGLLKLTIPVIKNSGQKTPFHEVKIDLKDNWHKIHARTIKAAYGSSPFYEFYIDDIREIWEKPSVTLMENNLRCHQIICRIMEWNLDLNLSEAFEPGDKNELGRALKPEKFDQDEPTKSASLYSNFESYNQVFQSEDDFIANLSILDLIFNLGPQSEIYLKR